MKRIIIMIIITICNSNLLTAQYSTDFYSLDNNCLAYKVNVSKDKIKYEGFVIDVRKQREDGNFHDIYPVDKEYDSTDFFVPKIETIFTFEEKLLKIEKHHLLKRYIKRNFKEEIYIPKEAYALENYIRQYLAYEFEGKKYLVVWFNFLEDRRGFTRETLEGYYTYCFTAKYGAPRYYYLRAIYDIENEEIVKYTVTDN